MKKQQKDRFAEMKSATNAAIVAAAENVVASTIQGFYNITGRWPEGDELIATLGAQVAIVLAERNQEIRMAQQINRN